MARALLRDPTLNNKFHTGTAREGMCVHCTKCLATIYEALRAASALIPEKAEDIQHVRR